MFDFLKKRLSPAPPPINEEVKVKDFPKDEYDAYWEVYTPESDTKFYAEVRIYHRKDGLVKTIPVEDLSKENLQRQINKTIVEQMSGFKKGGR